MSAAAAPEPAPPVLACDLVVEADGWGEEDGLLAHADRVAAAVLARIPQAVVSGSEWSLLLVDDAAMRGINAEHRGLDKPTNVLSFPMQPAGSRRFGPMVGDVVVARETVAREAGEGGLSFDHHYTHMIVHGLLHLFGYDHVTPADAEIMEALEVAVLADLGIADPYADSEPA